MIYHCLLALLFVAYLEITGQYILYRLNKNDYPLAFGFGLMALMSYCYITTSILTNLDCSFYLIFAIYAIYIVASFVFIFKDFKKVNWHFDIRSWIIALVFVGVMFYYAYNTTLGDTNAFDSVFYINFVSTNIGNPKMNRFSLYFGGAVGSNVYPQYSFQSYYYFVSCFVFVFRKLLAKLTLANNFTVFVWVFQIVYNFFFVSLLLNAIDKICKEKKLLKYFILFIYLFFYGKIYFNNVYGFYGNTFRTISISYAILSIINIFKFHNKSDWLLLGICIYASCAFSSTSLFIVFFILFALYFVLVLKEANFFKYYAFLLFFPILNLLAAAFYINVWISALISILICALLFVLNDLLIKISNYKYTRKALFILSFLMMVFLSYKITGNLLDISAFFDNGSGVYDMNINYFSNRVTLGENQVYFRYLTLFLFAYVCLFEFKNPLIMSFIIIVLVILNPICCAFLNKINPVWYRSFEIMANPCTMIYYLNLLFNRFNYKYVYYPLLLCLFIMFLLNIDFKTPLYYHKSYIPSDDYNNLLKMNNDEYDVLNRLKSEVEYNNIEEPYIVTLNLFTESFIPYGHYIYGRELIMLDGWTTSEIQIYSMFYPKDEYGVAYEDVKPDYDNMAEYLKDAGIDYLVIGKDMEYYDSQGYYNYIYLKVEACGYGSLIYSNDSYELFYFEH